MLNHTHPELHGAKYVAYVDRSRRYVGCSENAAKLVGYDQSELLTLKIDDLSFDNLYLTELFEKYQSHGHQEGEFILKRKDGTPVLVRYKAWVFDDGCHAASWEPAEEWEQLYLAALLEKSPATLRNKANAALSAIKQHQLSCDGLKRPESDRLRAASGVLRSLLT